MKMETVKFEELGLYPQLLRAIKEMGFEEATPIQSQAIPVVMSGVDVIGQAQTGTGKTASFGIPLLMKVDPNNKKTQAIVLSPTRELAIQSAEEIRKLAKYMHGIKVLPIYGGQDISRQIKALKGGATIIIGTPGRVMDHLRRKTIRCDYINTIVLDEADEMLNMGFREDIETILSYIPDEDRQTVLFSATMPKPILEITRKFQHDATTIKVTKKELTVPNIDQYYYDVRRNDKMEVLTRLLDYYNPKLSLVFCNTKRMVDELASELQGRGYAAEGIHGDMKQVQRDRVMKKFRNGKTDILIATDVAARGIDVDDVEAVFNYDLPQDNEYYVHRIGRTGRAGRTGKAFNFVKGKEVYKLKEIQRYCKTKIKAQPIPSSDDVAAIKADKILDGIGQMIEDGDLRDMIELIEQQVNNSDYTAMDIAAAFLKQAIGGVELSKEDHEFDDALAGDTGAEEGMVRLFINIGKSQRIRPGDILGAVAGEAKIPGKLVGAIDMYDNYTFVEVPQEYGKDVLKAMKNVKIKGKSVNVEPANARYRIRPFLGIFTMGEAANGKDAMDQIEKLQPQIVLSDVVMPLMDGVDFTVAVHHRYPHIQMIILSGYDNFEYVKQTLMQGVVDYILKPTLTPHELLGVLQKAAARIPGWHPDHAMTGETAEELLKELLLGETKTGEELQKVFAASYYCMYAVTIAHGSERAAETAELLCEKIQRAKSEFSGVLICSLPTGILFLVLQKSFANGIVGAVKG